MSKFYIQIVLVILSSFFLISCDEKAVEPEEKANFILRYAIVMDPMPESHGTEFYTFTYYPEKDITLYSMFHFYEKERLNDTLSLKIGVNDEDYRVYPKVKANITLGISKQWEPNKNRYFKFFIFPEKIISSYSDSVVIYHYPEDTLFSTKRLSN